jgi:peptidyl-prolyl cis-trans isomerase D
MIQFLRDKATSIVAKIFLFLLAISFGLWGVEGAWQSYNADPVALEVGDQTVQLQQVATAYRQIEDTARRQLGNEIDPAIRRMLLEQTVSQFTQQLAIAQLATDLNLPVARETLRREIAAAPVFQNEAGQFDPLRFEAALQQLGIDEQTFLDRTAAEHGVRALWQTMLDSVPTPAPLVEAVARQATIQRRVTFVSLPVNAKDVQVTDKALIAYHAGNAQNFMAPEQRTLDVVQLDPAALAKPDAVTDAAIKTYYDKNLSRFSVPEQRTVIQVVLPTEKDAKAAAALLKGRKTALRDVPGKIKTARLVDLGSVRRDSLLPALAEAAFALQKPGIVPEPVQSPLGWHLLQVTAIQAGSVTPLAKAQGEIRQTLAGEAAYEEAVAIAGRIEDAVFAGTPLAEAAKAEGVPVLSVAGLTLNDEGDRAGATALPEALRAAPRLRQDAFRAALHEGAAFSELPDGSLFSFSVTAITPAKPQEFAAARKDVEAAYRRTEALTAARTRAEAIRAAVTKGAALDKAASGLKVTTTPFILRTATPSGLSPEAVDLAFNAPLKQAMTSETASETNSAVVVLVPVAERQRPGQTEADKAAARTAATQAVEESLRQAFGEALQTTLQQRYPVQRNEAALARLVAQ